MELTSLIRPLADVGLTTRLRVFSQRNQRFASCCLVNFHVFVSKRGSPKGGVPFGFPCKATSTTTDYKCLERLEQSHLVMIVDAYDCPILEPWASLVRKPFMDLLPRCSPQILWGSFVFRQTRCAFNSRLQNGWWSTEACFSRARGLAPCSPQTARAPTCVPKTGEGPKNPRRSFVLPRNTLQPGIPLSDTSAFELKAFAWPR